MAEKALFEILSNDEDVSEAVGGQICPVTLSQNMTLPFIVYSVSDYEPYITQEAITGGKTTITITTYAETYKEAALIQRIIQLALSYKNGTYAGLPVKNIAPQGKSSLDELSGDGSEKPIYSIAQDYLVLHGER